MLRFNWGWDGDHFGQKNPHMHQACGRKKQVMFQKLNGSCRQRTENKGKFAVRCKAMPDLRGPLKCWSLVLTSLGRHLGVLEGVHK